VVCSARPGSGELAGCAVTSPRSDHRVSTHLRQSRDKGAAAPPPPDRGAALCSGGGVVSRPARLSVGTLGSPNEPWGGCPPRPPPTCAPLRLIGNLRPRVDGGAGVGHSRCCVIVVLVRAVRLYAITPQRMRHSHRPRGWGPTQPRFANEVESRVAVSGVIDGRSHEGPR
jgi:hypothetical protein